jgi:hypothetical protein
VRREESVEQRALVAWADSTWMPGRPGERIGEYLYAIPNGGARRPVEAAILKGEGVRAGMLDLCLAFPAHGHHGLYIEMKRRKGGVTSPKQREWASRLTCVGYRAEVCAGYEAARAVILNYLGVV